MTRQEATLIKKANKKLNKAAEGKKAKHKKHLKKSILDDSTLSLSEMGEALSLICPDPDVKFTLRDSITHLDLDTLDASLNMEKELALEGISMPLNAVSHDDEDKSPESDSDDKPRLTDKEEKAIKKKKREAYARRKNNKNQAIMSTKIDRSKQLKLARRTKEATYVPDSGIVERVFIDRVHRASDIIEDFEKSLSARKREANEVKRKLFDRQGHKIKTSYRADPKRVAKKIDYKEKAKIERGAKKAVNLANRAMKASHKEAKYLRKKARQAARPITEADFQPRILRIPDPPDIPVPPLSLAQLSHLWNNVSRSTYWEDTLDLLDYMSDSGSDTEEESDNDSISLESDYGFSSQSMTDPKRYLGFGAAVVSTAITQKLLQYSDPTTKKIFKAVNIFLAFCTSTSVITDYAILNILYKDFEMANSDMFDNAWERLKRLPRSRRFVSIPDDDTSHPHLEAEGDYKFQSALHLDENGEDPVTPMADRFRDTFRSFKYLMEVEFIEALRNLNFSLDNVLEMPRATIKKVERYFGPTKRMTIFEAVDMLVSSLGKFMEYGELASQGLSVQSVLLKRNAIYDLAQHHKMWEAQYPVISYGLPVGHSRSAKDFIVDLSDWLMDVNHCYKKVRPISTDADALRKMQLWGNAVYREVKSQLQSKRAMPYAIILHGRPGIGKSTILDMIYSMFSYAFGRTFDHGMVYERNKASEYWDQYDPWSMPYIHISELGGLHSNIAKSKGDPALTEVCSLVDSQPFPVNMAVAEKKGKVFANPELVVVDTNNSHLNASHCVSNPAAVMRRFLFIRPTVIAQYATEDGRINTAITDKDTFYKKWTFDVYLRTPLNNVQYMDKMLMTRATVDELEAFLLQDITRHFSEDAAKSTSYVPNDKKFKSKIKALSKFQMLEERKSVRRHSAVESDDDTDYDSDSVAFSSSSDESNDDRPYARRGRRLRQQKDEIKEDSKEDHISEYSDDGDSSHFSDDVKYAFSSDDSDEEVPNLHDILNSIGIRAQHRAEDPAHSFIDSVAKTEAFYSNVVNSFYDGIGHYGEITRRCFAYSGRTCSHGFNLGVSTFKSFGVITGAMLMTGVALSRLKQTYVMFCQILIALSMLMAAVFYSPFLMFLSVFFLLMSYIDIGPLTYYWRSQTMQSIIHSETEDWKNKFKTFKTWFISNPADLAIGLAHIAAAVIVVKQIVNLIQGDIITEGQTTSQVNTDFPIETEETKRTNTWEERIGTGSPIYRVVNKHNAMSWTTVNLAQMDSAHSGEISELYSAISNNIRKFEVELPNGNHSRSYAFGLCSNYFIVPKHAFGTHDIVGMKFRLATNTDPSPSAYMPGVVCDINHQLLGADHVVLFVLQALSKDVRSHFASSILRLKNADAQILNSYVRATYIGKLECDDKNFDRVKYNHAIRYSWDEHKVGQCGLPVVWTTAKGKCAIAGVHIAGHYNSNVAYAVLFTRTELEECIDKFDTGFMKAHSLGEEEPASSPHAQSLVLHEEISFPTYLGNVGTTKTFNQISKLRKTKVHSTIQSKLDEVYGPQVYTTYQKPLMKSKMKDGEYINPYNVTFRKFANPKKSLNLTVLKRTIKQVTAQICGNLENVGISEMRPYNIETAFNGSAFDYYCRSVDLSKSAGYGTPGKKRNYVYEEKDNVYPKDQILKEINDLIDAYSKGYIVKVPFEANLKDEPRAAEKVAKGATRVFYATPYAFYIVTRAFLMPLTNHMAAHSECFYSSIGIDMHTQAGDVYNRINDHSRNVIEGDYSGYDTSMPVDIGMASATIINDVLVHFGYTEEQMVIVRGILTESTYVSIIMNGDKFFVPGLQPSGKLGTAEDNSLRGLIMLAYAWNMSEYSDLDFFKYVAVCTYGDDVVASVSDETKNFDSIYYAKCCSDYYGLRFTTASKKDVNISFITPDEMSFLKRTFCFSDELDRVIAPLSMDSIARSCSWYLPSNHVSLFTQLESTVMSALRELFFHSNEEQYNTMSSFLNEYLLDNAGDLPTYYTIKDSLSPVQTHIMDEKCASDNSYVTPISECGFTDCSVDRCCVGEGFRRPSLYYQWRAQILIEQSLDELKEVEFSLSMMEDPYPGFSLRDLKKIPSVRNNPKAWTHAENYHYLLSRKDSLISTILRLDSALKRKQTVFLEADMGDAHADLENLHDVAGLSPIVEEEDKSQYFETGQRNYLSLEDYLSRPLEIATASIAPGTHLTFSTEIWDAFLDQPSVRAKLRNYAYIRGDMNVRITISGSPFHYAKVQLSYQPYGAYNESLNYFDGLLLGANRQQALVYLSQSPNVGYLDVRDNQPLDMKLPFICAQPMLRLYNNSPLVIADTTPFSDASNLGRIYLNTLNTVRSASATPTSISVFVYAWMTDVEFGSPTGTVLQVGTESDMGDERIVGPIESISSKLAMAFNYASAIPVLAPFTSVASTISGTISGIASLFGFSKPTMNTEPLRTNPQAFQNGAYTIGYDTTKKICLDPKQELTVDAHCVATDSDDMIISELCARESLLDIFEWQDTDTPLGTSIWLSPVNPIISDRYNQALTTYTVCPTPMAWVARMFKFWRGDITYRIEIVCSQYHRGKLAIYYEPNVPQNVVIDASLDINKQYIKVIDIQEVQDLTFTIEWAFPRAWARVGGANMDFDLGTVGFGGTNWFDSANGYIAIVPFTSLQSPDGSDISVNVYTYSDNICFNRLDGFLSVTRPSTESDMGESKVDLDIVLNPSSASMEHIGQMHFGEIPLSFRALLKRYMYRTYVTPIATGTATDIGLRYNSTLYPELTSVYDGVPSIINMFNYLRYGYLGMKGGMKYRAGLIGKVSVPDCGLVNVTLLDEGDVSADQLVTINQTPFFLNYAAGSVAFHINTNGGVEYELPLYTNNMFLMSFSSNPVPTGETTFDPSYTDSYRVVWPIMAIDSLPGTSVEVNMAVGDDFSFVRFQGCPAYTYTL
jgi:hypothetical protein